MKYLAEGEGCWIICVWVKAKMNHVGLRKFSQFFVWIKLIICREPMKKRLNFLDS